MIDPEHKKLSIRKQARMLGVNRKRLRRLIAEADITYIPMERGHAYPVASLLGSFAWMW